MTIVTITAEEVLRVRKALRMSQPEFAKAMGCGLRSITAWEQGEREMTAYPYVREFMRLQARVKREAVAAARLYAGLQPLPGVQR